MPIPGDRCMDRFTNLTNLEYQALRKAAWEKEARENYWGSAHVAPRYLARIESNISAMTAKEITDV